MQTFGEGCGKLGAQDEPALIGVLSLYILCHWSDFEGYIIRRPYIYRLQHRSYSIVPDSLFRATLDNDLKRCQEMSRHAAYRL